ncbi:MAG: SDR family oxidoreductase [Ectothiorhodospiraceae bacterium]|nr:SDR family oxidoreductase [Chromatiales bacterium]MCP5154930.1 SDR family oxidoreductase [Ectothiorhodospiraceae bacterium]
MITANLKGRRALVTGGASGIGLACVTQLAGAGARVALNHLPDDPAGPERVAALRADGLDVIAAPGNVAVPGEAERMVADAVAALGGLDYLVNNAGTPGTSVPIPPSELDRMTEEFWQKILSTNLIGSFRCAHAAASALTASSGAIVNLASIAAFDKQGSSLAYAASKAGVVSMTKSLARALGPAVRVNAVAPGAVNSPWQKDWGEARKQMTIDQSLLKRRCEPEDIAEVVLFLCAGGRMITGQTVVIDGGLTL